MTADTPNPNAPEIVRLSKLFREELGRSAEEHETTSPSFMLDSADAGLPGTVTLTFPGLRSSIFVEWLGPRLIYWPGGVETRHRTAIVSSRIGRRKDLKPWWFDALRTAVLRSDVCNDCLCCVDGTASADAVRRASELFGIRRLRIEFDGNAAVTECELSDWLQRKCESSADRDSKFEAVACLSPPLKVGIPESTLTPREQLSAADMALILSGQRIVVLSIRDGGQVERIIERHLSDQRLNVPVLLASVRDTAAETISPKLVEAGAVPWILHTSPSDDNTEAVRVGSAANETKIAPNITGPIEDSEAWLCHWTRARYGPWLNQPEEDFWDELILGCRTADRSALAALMHIVEQRLILASHSSQHSTKTVSLTAVPLCEFRKRRVFRKHKQQYDFEPWGVAVRRTAIEALGGQPVVYVDRNANSNDASNSPFVQVRTNDAGTIDWSTEKEWRYCGDLNLAELSASDLYLFAPGSAEVLRLREVSPWPVILVPEHDANSTSENL